MRWTIEEKQPNVHRLVYQRGTGDEHTIHMLIASDVHFDSKDCDRRLLKEHLDQAQEREAAVLILGDWFDAMRSTGDKRMTHGAREGLDRLDYLDALVDESVAFLEPYKENIALVTQGNHESAMKRFHNTDLTRRLAVRLGRCYAPYRGWLFLQNGDSKQARVVRKIYYDHGSGGSAPVTRGVIKTNRRAVMVPDADIVLSGHIHERWVVNVPRIRLSPTVAEERYEEQIHASSGTYKRESLQEGWAAEKGFGPPAVGGLWLEMAYKRKEKSKRNAQQQEIARIRIYNA